MERWSDQPSSNGRLRVSRSHGDPVVLALAGELDTATLLSAARPLAMVLAERPPPHAVVVDLTELRFLAVAGARMLHAAVDYAAGKTAVRIALGPNQMVARVFAVTGLAAMLDTYPDRTTALQAGRRDQFVQWAQQLWHS
ncbi:STAS domain-containing protein [Amycolatopsis sp. NPDC098790]|uniref:STAS domain-containing protein n=1 Tax=Amycolatopsis sp. NPDC098790 TaxID=3363939 RepID=UPI00380E790A